MSADSKSPRLYSPSRRGYMRATREQGIRAELDAMSEEARGTPFFDSGVKYDPPSRASGMALAERLTNLRKVPR